MANGAGGRPLKFQSVEELQAAIDDYFESCYEPVMEQEMDKKGKPTGKWRPVLDHNGEPTKRLIRPYTVSGLAVHLGTRRQTLLNYEQRDEFLDTIQKARARIENFVEEALFTSRQTAGIIFNLTNNFGWLNRQERIVYVDPKTLTDAELKRMLSDGN